MKLTGFESSKIDSEMINHPTELWSLISTLLQAITQCMAQISLQWI